MKWPIIDKQHAKKVPGVRRAYLQELKWRSPFYLFIRRLYIATGLITSYSILVLRWLFGSREATNYTYHVTDLNRRQLSHFISNVTCSPLELVDSYIDEILHDKALKQHVSKHADSSPYWRTADNEARYGRRIGWYALVRLTKPHVVVETGLDKGLGTCVLAAAVLKNRDEGAPGTVHAIDFNPVAGWSIK